MSRLKGCLPVFAAWVLLAITPAGAQETVNYSGAWILDMNKSALEGRAARMLGLEMVIIQSGEELKIEYNFPVHNYSDKVSMTIGGEPVSRRSGGRRGGSKMRSQWSGDKKNLLFISESTFTRGDSTYTFKQTETLSLSPDKNTLIIKRESNSSRFSENSELVFDRKK